MSDKQEYFGLKYIGDSAEVTCQGIVFQRNQPTVFEDAEVYGIHSKSPKFKVVKPTKAQIDEYLGAGEEEPVGEAEDA